MLDNFREYSKYTQGVKIAQKVGADLQALPCRCLALLAHLALAGLAGVQTLLLLEVEDHGVDDQGGEHEEDAGKHPQLYRGQSLRLRGVLQF